MEGTRPDVNLLIDAFRELDISIGNGLIGDAQLLQPAKRALFIGLGGTGNKALRRLKRIIYQRYDHVDQNFGFFGIDTDNENPVTDKEYMLLSQDEKILLTANEDFFTPRKRELMNDYIRIWLNDETAHSVRGDGAGGKRAAARALLFNSAVNIINKFQNEIMRIRSGDLNTRIDIFILAGIGGGTGSGTLLDIAYILRGIMKNIAHAIHAYIFMPDINLSVPLPSGTKEYIPANAFAALKEIDYWMNIMSRDDVFIQQYTGNFSVEEKNTPFDYCWPMTATNSNGMLVIDALNQASTVAAEVICAWIAFREANEAVAATNTFIQTFTANMTLERDIFKNGLTSGREGISLPVPFDYLVCGASVAKLPISAINTYLACILFSRFSRLYEHAFDDRITDELQTFCSDKTIAIEYEQIKRNLEGKFKTLNVRMPDLSTRPWGDLFENDAERDFIYNLGQFSTRMEAVKIQIIKEKIDAMKVAFREIFTDSKKGPYFLNVFIQNGNSGLIATLENYKRLISIEKGRLVEFELDLERRKNDAYRNGKNAIFITRSRHVKEYSEALSRYYMNQRDKIFCDACTSIYNELQDQLSKRVSALYNATFTVLDALNITFKRNIDTFNSAVNIVHKKNAVEYSWDIFTLPEIVNLVLDTLNERGIGEEKQEALVKDLLTQLLNLIENEIKRYEAVNNLNDVSLQGLDINRFLANFIATNFDYLTKKNLKDYLDAIAKNKGQTLKEYLVKQFQSMERDASPLFDKHPPAAGKLYYSAIPVNGMSDIEDAWLEYASGDQNRKAFASDNGETLVFMTIGVGTPLYAAKLLEEAEEAYNHHMKDHGIAASMRLVSSTKMSVKNGHQDIYWDWRHLPSPIPADMRSESLTRTKDRDWESTCKNAVDRLKNKKILQTNQTTGKCSYVRLIIADFKKILDALLPGGMSPGMPASKLRECKSKIIELQSIIYGESIATFNVAERFGVFFELSISEFQAAIHNDWGNPLHEVITVYSRSLNIRRELEKTEAFFNALSDMLNEINLTLKEIEDSASLSEKLVKGFLCGIFTTNGKQWQYIDEDGETQTFARLGDRYPFYLFYEKFLKLKNREDILALIEANYEKAVDSATLEEEKYGIFKDLFKREYKKIKEDGDANESQLYLMERVSQYISDLDL